jgi:hypothetical protein
MKISNVFIFTRNESSSLVDGRYRAFSYLGGLSSNTRAKNAYISKPMHLMLYLMA